MNRKLKQIPSILFLSVLLGTTLMLSGCSQASTPPAGDEPTGTESPVIIETSLSEDPSVETTTYPPPAPTTSTQSAYPAPDSENTSDIPSVRFSLDEPIQAGAVQIDGDGPGGTLLDVVDITDIPAIIGSGVIGEDNRLSIDLSGALEQNQVNIEM